MLRRLTFAFFVLLAKSNETITQGEYTSKIPEGDDRLEER
jgi:hypothetical protein